MKMLLTASLASSFLLLSGCKLANGLVDFTGSLAINDEVVLTTTSSIDAMKADTSAHVFSPAGETALAGLGVTNTAHDGTDSCYVYTKYPVVFVHGLYGFHQIFGEHFLNGKIPGISYWYRAVEAIDLGGGNAFEITVPKLSTSEIRGEALKTKLQNLQVELAGKPIPHAATCDPLGPQNYSSTASDIRFNLIGHSHGGPTTRYIIDAAPQLLASITTVGGLNVYGIPESENQQKFMDALKSFTLGPLIQGMMNGLAEIIEAVGGNEENDTSWAVGSFDSLSADGIYKFNLGDAGQGIAGHNTGLPPTWNTTYNQDCNDAIKNNTAMPAGGIHSADLGYGTVYFFSWSGTGTKTNVLDPTDILIDYVVKSMCDDNGVGCEPSDGMVQQCSSHFGLVLRDDYNFNHLDEINWFMGLRKADTANPLVIYRQTANRLKQLGK